MKDFFITGGTGYMGTRLTRRLIKQGHRVHVLAREGSAHKVPPGANIVTGDPFDSRTFQSSIPAGSVFIQLLGVAHPSPKKAEQFKEIDLRSVKASADAAVIAGVSRFIYVSVAMAPSSLMQAYQEVRKQGEAYCLHQNLNCIFIRPWYVIGPGHWWPLLLLPVYGLAELKSDWRKKARAMALVTIGQMIQTLVYAACSIESPQQVLEVKDIRRPLAKKF